MKKIWIWLMPFIVVEVILLSEKDIPRKIADLEKKLNSVTGKAKVDLLNQLSLESFRHEPQKSIDYARQALALSRDLKYSGGEARAYINLGTGYSYKGINYQESRLKLFLAGIDKHFLFNSLDSIIGLERIPNQLKDNLKKLSELYRYILTSSDRLVIPLKEELEAVKNYLEIEQKILKGRLFFEILEIEEHVLACEIMPQLLLTLTENAVKHGIYQKENGGTIFIDIQKKNKSLIIEVIDTGPAFSREL
jgi:signal transduction histidine kinase